MPDLKTFCALALDGAGRHAPHEVALEGDENGEGQRHLQDGCGRQELPAATQ
jgi:hypothetical protein